MEAPRTNSTREKRKGRDELKKKVSSAGGSHKAGAWTRKKEGF